MKSREVREKGVARGFGRDGDVRVKLDSGDEVWASGLVPGDVVELVVEPKSKPRRGRVLRILENGPDRREPLCPLATRCGGCSLAHVTTATAERIKRDAVARAVSDAVPVRFVASPSETGYRRRARLHFAVRGGSARLGYRPPRSNDLVDVPRCIVLDPRLDAAARAFRERVLPTLEGQGDLRLALGNGGVVASIRTGSVLSPSAYDAVGAAVTDGTFVGFAIHAYGATTPATFGDPVERTPQPEGADLEGTVDGFSQANDPVALAMAETVRSESDAHGLRVLELYAGHGHLSIGLARDAATFVAVESARDAAAALERNLRERGIEGRVLATDSRLAPRGGADVVVLDPPRTGAEAALDAVLANRPSRIVMASCDARTLERDLATLGRAGYRVVSATAFDMFPGTPHVEAVVRLDRSE